MQQVPPECSHIPGVQFYSFPQRFHQFLKAIHRRLQILNDIRSEDIGIGEAVQVGQGFVLDPEDVEAGLVALEDLVHGEFAPAAVGIGFRPGFVAVMAVFGVIAADEVLQVDIGHGVLLQGEVDVGTEIVDPDLPGLHVGAGRLLVVEDDIGLDTGLVEDAGGQPQDGVQVGGLQQLLADDLTGTALEEDIVRHHHSGVAVDLEDGVDVLEEVELLVGAGGPEVLAVVDQLLVLLLALLVGDGDGGFFAEGRIGQHIVHPVAGVGEQGIAQGDGDIAVDVADVVQVQVHQGHLEGGADQLVAVEGLVFQEELLVTGQGEVVGVGEELLGRQEEAAAAAAGVCDGLAGLGAQALDHGLDEGPGGEVLTGTGLDILGVFLEQALVDLALDIGGHGDPLFLVDHLHHPVEDGGVADLVGGLFEDLTQQTALLAQLFQGGLVLLLQLGSPEGIHILPAVAGGDAGFFFIRGSGVLIGHFQKDEVSKLLQIISIGNAVIPEGIAQAPDLGDYGGGLFMNHFPLFLLYFSILQVG